MKKFSPLLLLLITLGVIASSPGYSQVHFHHLRANHAVPAITH